MTAPAQTPPLLYRLALALLGALMLVGGLAGIWAGARLDGFAALRGLLGGLIAGAVGVRLVMYAFAKRRPVWLARLLGEGEESG